MLDAQALHNLDDMHKARYQKLEKLVTSDGWPLFVEWAQENAADCHNRAAMASSWSENRIAIGGWSVYNQLVHFEEGVMAEFAQLASQNEQARLEREVADEEHFES